jgi:hypothetical protein
MKDKVKEDILSVLKESLKAIKGNDIVKLKDLSDRVIHNASMLQEEYSISIAVIIHSISKIFGRTRYRNYKEWDVFYKEIVDNLNCAKVDLEKGNITEYEHHIHSLLQSIDRLGKKFRKYVIEVINKVKISKGSRIHEHGLSVGKTAELLGISEWELMEYVGGTGISDVKYNVTMTAKDRLKLARRVFG